ncbi:MAG: RNA polymerase sigma factor [Planctomycetota bacterium]|jgi:RNA polymerase sigma-70 factor (ECF subfamily)
MTPDESLVRRVLAGETAAFRPLVERHQGPLFGFVGNLLRHGQDCEDVVQDVLLTAYERLGSYDAGRARFSTWLFTIARNRCLNVLSSRRRHARHDAASNGRAPRQGAPAEPIGPGSPERDAVAGELLRHLDATFATLPLDQRMAFVLARFVGLPHAEIAAIEGVEVGTIKSRIARAREALRAGLPRGTEVSR